MNEYNYLKDFLLVLLIGLGLGWLTKDMIGDWLMTRRSKRATWKTDKDEIQGSVAMLLQTLEVTQKVTPGGIDRFRGDLRKLGYKDTDLEPKFTEGKPFYSGPAKLPDVNKLKSQIKGRLGRGWRAAMEALKLRRRTSKDKFAHIQKFRKSA